MRLLLLAHAPAAGPHHPETGEIAALIQKVPDSAVTVVLVDPLHLRRSGGTPEDVAACVAAHPDRFTYAQLCDAPLQPHGDGRHALSRPHEQAGAFAPQVCLAEASMGRCARQRCRNLQSVSVSSKPFLQFRWESLQ